MKQLLTSLILSTGLSLASLTTTLAQEQQGCFMVDENGQPIDLSSLCGSSDSQQIKDSGVFYIPIKGRLGGTPVVEVNFNGQQKFAMLFDTGATGTVISSQMAQVLGVKQEGTARVNTASQNSVEFALGRLQSLETGGLIINNLVVAISPTLDLGLLGQDVYGNYNVTITESVIELRVR